MNVHDRQCRRHHLEWNARRGRRTHAEAERAAVVELVDLPRPKDAKVHVRERHRADLVAAVEIDRHLRHRALQQLQRLTADLTAPARLSRLVDITARDLARSESW